MLRHAGYDYRHKLRIPYRWHVTRKELQAIRHRWFAGRPRGITLRFRPIERKLTPTISSRSYKLHARNSHRDERTLRKALYR